jgi:hypothetical protein
MALPIKFRILNGIIRKSSKKGLLTPYVQSKTFGLVVHQPAKKETQGNIAELKHLLRNDGKIVEEISFYSPKKPVVETETKNQFQRKIFDKKDFSLFGFPQSKELKKTVLEDYDYLIFCNPKADIRTASFAILSKSKCVVGPSKVDQFVHMDFVIEADKCDKNYFTSIYNTINQFR